MSTSPMRERVSSVMESIVAHVASNAGAADTADGIRQAWLSGAATAAEVDLALERLVADGALVARALPDGSVLFSAPGRA